MSRTPIILFGVVVAVIGFAGNMLFGRIMNPPTTAIAVAVVEISPGTVLTRDMVGIDDARLNRQVATGLVQESELPQFVGGVVVEPIHAYQPISKAAIVAEGNPASQNRLALALSDPTLVAMVVPVSPETSPASIAPGDYVDLNFGVGSAAFLAGSLSAAPTPLSFAYAQGGSFQPLPGLVASPPAQLGTAAPTATEEPRITLPVAKTIVADARVLSVVYDEAPNPAYAGPSSGEPATIRGDILALVVALPRDAEEIVHFAIVNGSIRVALLSPKAEIGQGRKPTLGMSWDDMIALFRLERDQALAAGQPDPLQGPGAAAVKATWDAAAAQSATSVPTPTSALSTVERPTGTPAP